MGDAEARAVRAAVGDVLASSSWILGAQVDGFEREWAAYVGAHEGHVVGLASGTDALVVALSALRLPAGAEVLVPCDDGGFAAFATVQAGLVPRLMDTGDAGPTVADAEAARTDRTVGLVVTHLHGNPVPLDELDEWRVRHGLVLVEDCAQAHGLRVDTVHVGLRGDAAAFSFYPTKNLGAPGDGGAAVFARAQDAERARSLRQYGWDDKRRIVRPGGRNSRLDELHAAVLRARLPFLDGRNARRRDIAAAYAEQVTMLGAQGSGVAHHAVAVLGDRDRVADELRRQGVETAIHYPWLVSEMPGIPTSAVDLPRAARRRDRVLSLPCFPEMTDEEVDAVCAALSRATR
jgi:dTDP-4-amino-4,6-dideoxygalactose transaminase